MYVVCVVIVMSSKAQDEKAVYDAAGNGKTDVIKTLFEKGTDLNGYKDEVSKSLTFRLLILLETSILFLLKPLIILISDDLY